VFLLLLLQIPKKVVFLRGKTAAAAAAAAARRRDSARPPLPLPWRALWPLLTEPPQAILRLSPRFFGSSPLFLLGPLLGGAPPFGPGGLPSSSFSALSRRRCFSSFSASTARHSASSSLCPPLRSRPSTSPSPLFLAAAPRPCPPPPATVVQTRPSPHSPRRSRIPSITPPP